MFKRTLILNAAALALATTFASQPAKADPEFYTVTVEAGQGSPISIRVPVSPPHDAETYALSGQAQTPPNVQSISVQPGQGSPISVAVADSNAMLARNSGPAGPGDTAPGVVAIAHAD
jgi:hypothetical protein